MVRIINIDTKTRTIRIENADGDIKTWRTTESGTHFPIKEGQTTKEGLDEFLKKHVIVTGIPDKPAKKEESPAERASRESASAFDRLLLGIGDKKNGVKKAQPVKKESGPDKSADVSDIITDYKKKMKALGPRASINKTDRVQADAIKEFMTRKIGAGLTYDDYYNYWLNGMDEDTKDAFNEIYTESEARERAFSELSGQKYWAEDPDFFKGLQKPAKKNTDAEFAQRAQEEAYKNLSDDEREAIDIMRKWKRGEIGDDEFLKLGEKIKGLAISTIKPETKKESSFPNAWSEPKQQPAKKERNWWRGPRESEDAYFDRRDKTMAEARKIDKVADWYKKAYAGDDEIPTNKNITFDELAKGMLSGKIKDFYDTVGVGASDIRENIFEELSERTGRPYDDFYNAWLHNDD